MIRLFRPEDASACCSIIHACLEADASYPPALRAKIRAGETPESMTERAELFYIAVYEEEDRILGFAGLDLNEIRLLYVAPDSQRRGIGRSLLEHIKAMVPGAAVSGNFCLFHYRSCRFLLNPADLKTKALSSLTWAVIPLPTIFMALPSRIP